MTKWGGDQASRETCEINEIYAKIENILPRFARVVAFDNLTLVYVVPSPSLEICIGKKEKKKKHTESASLSPPLTTYGKREMYKGA